MRLRGVDLVDVENERGTWSMEAAVNLNTDVRGVGPSLGLVSSMVALEGMVLWLGHGEYGVCAV